MFQTNWICFNSSVKRLQCDEFRQTLSSCWNAISCCLSASFFFKSVMVLFIVDDILFGVCCPKRIRLNYILGIIEECVNRLLSLIIDEINSWFI